MRYARGRYCDLPNKRYALSAISQKEVRRPIAGIFTVLKSLAAEVVNWPPGYRDGLGQENNPGLDDLKPELRMSKADHIIARVSPDRKIMSINERFCGLLGVEASGFIGTEYEQIVRKQDHNSDEFAKIWHAAKPCNRSKVDALKRFYVLSYCVWCIGLMMNLSDAEVQILQIFS